MRELSGSETRLNTVKMLKFDILKYFKLPSILAVVTVSYFDDESKYFHLFFLESNFLIQTPLEHDFRSICHFHVRVFFYFDR